MLPTSVPSDFKPKSFWSKPEGTTGMIVIALIALGVAMGFNVISPIFITMFNNLAALFNAAIAATISAVGLALLALFVTNRKVWLLVNYGFKSVMRWITQWFVEIDPIGIMKGYISTLNEKLTELRESKSALKGQISIAEQKIQKNQDEAAKALKMVAAAREMGLKAEARGDQEAVLSAKSQMGINSNQHGRLTALNKRLEGALSKMQMLYKALIKYEIASANAITEIKNEVSVREQERDMIRASHKAMSKAMAILRGSGDEYELFEQAMEYTAAEYGKKLGEIEDFMDSTRGVLEGIDLQNGVWQAEALEKLAKFENQTDSLLLGGEKRLLIEHHVTESLPTRIAADEAVSVSGGDYQDQFFGSGRAKK